MAREKHDTMPKCKVRLKHFMFLLLISSLVIAVFKYEFDQEYVTVTGRSSNTTSIPLAAGPSTEEVDITISPADQTTQLTRNTSRKYNVLFLMADDFRPQIGAYRGKDYAAPGDRRPIVTPNLDRLASHSLLLTRAYAQYSLCGPSRASLLTSRRPDTTHVYQNFLHFRESGANVTTLPQYFKQHGYEVLGAGKIFHVDIHEDSDDRASWTAPVFHADNVRHVTTANVNWLSVPRADREDSPLEDEQLVSHTIDNLRRLAPSARSGDKPFFLAVGFYRPHVPHICPQRFYELYPLETGRYMSDPTWQSPSFSPFCTMASFHEGMDNRNFTRIPEDTMKELRRAYFACLSYVDHLIGQLLEALDDLGLAESTVVSFVSDHGYHLGENDWYSKYTSYEVSLHVPLMIHVPGRTDGGVRSRSLAELVDVFPTVAEAAGLGAVGRCPHRSADVSVCTEGVSLLPLVEQPRTRLRTAVFSQVSRGRGMTEYTARTHQYRLVDYATVRRQDTDADISDHSVAWDVNVDKIRFNHKLHDHSTDPEERHNVYSNRRYKKQREKIEQILHRKFTEVLSYPKTVYDRFS